MSGDKRELSRYARRVAFDDIVAAGQESFGQGTVLLIGAGGIGCVAASYVCGLLRQFDANRGEFRSVRIHKRAGCPACR
jgi:molybdopterin/thiamine biosynthesis adenylyltransferase